MPLMTLATYCRTLRHLRWSQLLWRVRYSLERRRRVSLCAAARWAWTGEALPRLRADLPVLPVFHCPAEGGAIGTALLRSGIFRHLNEEQVLGRERPDWMLGARTADRLWTVTLHYHAWAFALAEAGTEEAENLFRHYVSDWIARCTLATPGARPLAWNPYAIATRISWWVRAYRSLGDPWWADRPTLRRTFHESLWQQAAYLHDHLEWDLRGNHLLRDAVGLAWAGRFFAEEVAKKWLATATRLAVEQAREQVLSDGSHFERSPMYHLHGMEDVFSLALLVEDAAAQALLRDTWRRMAEYLAYLRHPDGDVPLFNDGGLGAACEPADMLCLAEHLGVVVDPAPRSGGHYFPDASLAAWHQQPWTVFFDVGAVGPDYQPGHAHADTLAIECSFQGRRLFVDPGTYGYDRDRRRQYDRSTEAHNTVCIDHQDSSEVWHIFRVGRRAYPMGIHVDSSDGWLRVEASHSGYHHLPGRPRHTRSVAVGKNGELRIIDSVTGSGTHFLRGGFLLEPAWRAAAVAGGWVLTAGADRVQVTVRGPEGLVLFEEQRPYHPEYGKELSTRRLGWLLDGPLPAEITVRVSAAPVPLLAGSNRECCARFDS